MSLCGNIQVLCLGEIGRLGLDTHLTFDIFKMYNSLSHNYGDLYLASY